MKYADIIIDIRSGQLDRTFQYIIPEELMPRIRPGVCVMVPFGRGKALKQGFVIGLSDEPKIDEDKLKIIAGIDEKTVPVESQLIELADWMRQRYGGTMLRSLQTVLPVRKRVKKRGTGQSSSVCQDDFAKNSVNLDYNTEQQNAVDAFGMDFDQGIHRVYLLHGVTGSGKTRVYAGMIDKVMRKGYSVIVLIPEIALTRQNIQRFSVMFKECVEVLHSRLSEGERYEVYKKVSDGTVRIVIGPRSALFTPFSDLGLIIVDEEHDNSYKSEQIPRYHARETAIKRAQLAGASVVFGSATPSMESLLRVQKGTYKLLSLPHRAGKRPLPGITIADMRKELASGNRSIFSRILSLKMAETLNLGNQIILFLNRRGMAGFVSCRSCGNVIKCPHCDVSLHLHNDNSIRCHYCGYRSKAPLRCPKCGSAYIGGFRAGTQSVEKQLKKQFPNARVIRMDADTTKHKGDHERLLEEFALRRADILLGTQMIVKGHDFPGVALVGVLAADLSLNGGDYSGAERTFDLLVQASGRAGRGDVRGEVVIQTYQPEHYAVTAAVAADVYGFAKQELSYRALMGYPPVGHMLLVRIISRSASEAGSAAGKICEVISLMQEGKMLLAARPSEALISRVKDSFRYAVYLKSSNNSALIKAKDEIEAFSKTQECERLFPDTHISFDFDPEGVF